MGAPPLSGGRFWFNLQFRESFGTHRIIVLLKKYAQALVKIPRRNLLLPIFRSAPAPLPAFAINQSASSKRKHRTSAAHAQKAGDQIRMLFLECKKSTSPQPARGRTVSQGKEIKSCEKQKPGESQGEDKTDKADKAPGFSSEGVPCQGKRHTSAESVPLIRKRKNVRLK